MLEIKDHISKGNKELPRSTWIFNISSATDCASKKLGMCQLKDVRKCYAMKAERLYPSVLPYRNRQAQLWKEKTAIEFADAIYSMNSRAQTQV